MMRVPFSVRIEGLKRVRVTRTGSGVSAVGAAPSEAVAGTPPRALASPSRVRAAAHSASDRLISRRQPIIQGRGRRDGARRHMQGAELPH